MEKLVEEERVRREATAGRTEDIYNTNVRLSLLFPILHLRLFLAATLTFPLQVRIVKALLFLWSGLCAVCTLNVLRGQHEQHYFTL